MSIKEMADKGIPLERFKVIDAHVHLGLHPGNYIAGDPFIHGLISEMDRLGIDISCLSAHTAVEGNYEFGNRIVSEAISDYPHRIIGLATINPNYPKEIEEELRKCFDEYKMKGIKIHPDLIDYPANGSNYRFMWKFAQERKSFVLSHTDSRGKNSSPKMFDKIARDYPAVTIILGHSGVGYQGIFEAMEIAKLYKNIRLEISGWRFSSFWLDSIVKEIGADKILFGTDMPFNSPSHTLGRVTYAKITEEEKRAILGTNMVSILNRSGNGFS